VIPTYPSGVESADLGALLGSEISASLGAGIREFSKKIRCFSADDAVLTGVETRTSSPLRIVRASDRQTEGIRGLYPCGEGAGYAGGIMSAAVDGLKSAMKLIEEYGHTDY